VWWEWWLVWRKDVGVVDGVVDGAVVELVELIGQS